MLHACTARIIRSNVPNTMLISELMSVITLFLRRRRHFNRCLRGGRF
jgi:hypothetical protein